MGPGRSERKKEQTGAGAAGRGAKPGRAVVGWCGRSAAGPPAGRAEQAGRGKREGVLGRPVPRLGQNRKKRYFSNLKSFSYLVFKANSKVN